MSASLANQGKKALVIDDDEMICCSLEHILGTRGFTVKSCLKAQEGLEEALEGNYDLVLIDVVLPGMNGFQLLKQLRPQTPVPVVMITSHEGEASRVYGFELGADDYIAKPFSNRELIARVEAVMRRSHPAPQTVQEFHGEKTEHGNLIIYRDFPKIACNGKVIELTSIEYRILRHLVANAGQEVKKADLAKIEIGQENPGNEFVIEVYIYLLRKKIGDNSKNPRFIKTVGDNAYMFIPKSKAISLEITP